MIDIHTIAHVEMRLGLTVFSLFCVCGQTKPHPGPRVALFWGASRGDCKIAHIRSQIVTAVAAADQFAAVKVEVAVSLSASCAGKVSDCTHMVPATES